MSEQQYGELARLGVATVHEAFGRQGLVDLPLTQVVPGSRVAGPARTCRCGHGDNLMFHALVAAARPGDVLVLTMDDPAPFGVVGELLATQAKVHGAAGLLIDAAVRDFEDLVALGLPIWTRWVRARGTTKEVVTDLDTPVVVGGQTIRSGDIIVMDRDGAVVVPPDEVETVLAAALAREAKEAASRKRYEAGELSYDLSGLRQLVESPPVA